MKPVALLCVVAAIVVAFLILQKCSNTRNLTEGLGGGGGGRGGGGGGGGRGGGGGGRGGGGGGRGGGGGGRGGGGRGGGRGGHHGGWGRRGWGGWGGGGGWGGWGGWWPSWWYDPLYYYDLYDIDYDVEADPCKCFNAYKAAIDAGVTKEDAGKILNKCAENC